MSTEQRGLFILPDGKNMTVTFFLVASLFLLWGFCNGMIDTMDKHFQDQLHLTKAQSDCCSSRWVGSGFFLRRILPPSGRFFWASA